MEKVMVQIVGILIIFISCQNIDNKGVVESLGAIDNESNEFIGKWVSVDNVIPKNAILWIKEDNTFKYEFKAGLSSGFSNGKWVLDSTFIVLNSNEIDTCLYSTLFKRDCAPISDRKSVEELVTTTQKGCNPEKYVIYVRFVQDSFYIHNDTLVFVQKEQYPYLKSNKDFIKSE